MGLEITAQPRAGIGPLWVSLEPKIQGLEGPVSYTWSFGDGKGSSEKQPGPHLFEFGKYSVVLTVTDGKGKKHTASVTIDASSPG
jgi:PKD repeat protein